MVRQLSVNRSTIKAAVLAAVAALLLVTPAPAADPPIFFTICGVSHIAQDDPIVHPDRPGAAHEHQFAGAWSTTAASTYASLRASGTTCDMAEDKAAYWVPTLYDARGRRVGIENFFAYFTAGIHEGPVDRSDIRPPPAGLKVVAWARNSRPGEAGWHCGDSTRLRLTTIPTCRGGDAKLQAFVGFPDCWDGVHLDSPDHRSHMAYARRNAAGARIGCPPSHPVPVTSLSVKIRYHSYGGPGFRLASGPPSTLHMDFFNAWDQAELRRLTQRCINDDFRRGEPCRVPQDGTHEPTPNPAFPRAYLAPGVVALVDQLIQVVGL